MAVATEGVKHMTGATEANEAINSARVALLHLIEQQTNAIAESNMALDSRINYTAALAKSFALAAGSLHSL